MPSWGERGEAVCTSSGLLYNWEALAGGGLEAPKRKMPRLTISLLGHFQATLRATALTSFESSKVRALLAYLAVEADQAHQRDVLAGLLWPHRSTRDALSNLRYALYDLRNVIGDREADPSFLSITRRTLQFNTASDYSLDVEVFEDLIEGLPTGAGLGAVADAPRRCPRFHDLASALALYRGPFLRGLSLDDSPAFEEWLLLKREQIDRQVGGVLCLLAEHEEHTENYAQARRYVRRYLEMQPWDERAHRRLMYLLALDGRRNAALAQYRTCLSTLSDELGVEPTAATKNLHERIRDGAVGVRVSGGEQWEGAELETTSQTRRSLQPTHDALSGLCVGRGRQLQSLDGFLEHSLDGQGCVAFVAGEAGSGKTTLVQTFANRAMETHKDLVVTMGACSTHSGIGDPYQPFREAIQLLAGDIEAKRAGGTLTHDHANRLWKGLPVVAQALVEQGPGLIDRFLPGSDLLLRLQGFGPQDPRLCSRLEQLLGRQVREDGRTPSSLPRSALFEQTTRALLALSKSHPLLLFLDDLQWIDPGSASLLFYLGQRLAQSRILLIGAYRPGALTTGESGGRHPLAPVIHELKREFGDAEVSLAEADGRALIDALLDREPNRLDEEFREALLHHTGGNPLFVTEFLEGLRERGDLIRDEDGRWSEGGTLDWAQLPARVEAIVAERIERLPRILQEMLLAASVEGEVFTAEVAAQVLNLDPASVVEAMSGPLSRRDHLVQAHSVEWLSQWGDPEGGSGTPPRQWASRYRFRHALFQTYLYRSADEVRRSHLHHRVGETLEIYYRSGVSGVGVSAAKLAWHFEAAGQIGKAVEYLLLAGKQAVELSAHEEAVELFTRALDLLEPLPSSPERVEREFELQVALGSALLAIQGWGATERQRVSERAYDLGRRIGGTGRLVKALFSLADLSRAEGDYKTSLQLGRQMLELARRTEDPRQLALAHGTLGETQVFRAALEDAGRHLQEALVSYDFRKHADLTLVTGPNLGVMCLVWDSWVQWILGHAGKALERSQRARALGREIDHPFSLAFALALSSAGLRFLRREYATARKPIEKLNDLVRQHDMPAMEVWAALLQGWTETFDGNVDSGIAQMRRAMTAWREMGALTGASFQVLLLVEVYQRHGRIGEALIALDESIRLSDEIGERLFTAEMHRLKGELLLQDGACAGNHRDARAREALGAALSVARKQKAKLWELRTAASLARFWKARGERERARRLLEDGCRPFRKDLEIVDLREARELLNGLSGD